MIEFFVPGAPVAAGSKRAFPIMGKDKRLHVAVSDASGARGKNWRGQISHAALAARRAADRDLAVAVELHPLRVALWFYVQRPRSHTGKRGLLPSAPTHPTTRPDVLKLARAVEDACTGILWRDDAQMVDELLHKVYADGDLAIGVRVQVTPLVDRAPIATLRARLHVPTEAS